MAYAYLTDNTATQCDTGRISKVVITVNAALTGSIKVIDNTTGTTANVATITNPAVGDRYEYWDFKTGVLIIPSTNCNITVNTESSYRH